jgi:hypothetical protein
MPFTLFPVFWSPLNSDMLKLQEMFKEGDVINIPNVHEPFACCSYLNEQNELRHRFVGISSLFTDEIIQEIKQR